MSDKILCTNLQFAEIVNGYHNKGNDNIFVIPAKSNGPEISYRLFYYFGAKFIGEVVYFCDGHVINLVPKLY